MNKYFYDLHIHSCLSPCADNDMTPGNIAGMGTLNGLNIMALTDHNSCKNCKSFFLACKAQGIVPVAGMELTTQEEIHMICLFPTLEFALDFDLEVEKHLSPIKNKPEIFGNQYLIDENDDVLKEEEALLIYATDIDLYSAIKMVKSYSGVIYPAHVDRQANGIVAILGSVPQEYNFPCVEYNDKINSDGKYKTVCSSDAHYLWDINNSENYFMLEDEPYSSAFVRSNLIEFLKK